MIQREGGGTSEVFNKWREGKQGQKTYKCLTGSGTLMLAPATHTSLAAPPTPPPPLPWCDHVWVRTGWKLCCEMSRDTWRLAEGLCGEKGKKYTHSKRCMSLISCHNRNLLE